MKTFRTVLPLALNLRRRLAAAGGPQQDEATASFPPATRRLQAAGTGFRGSQHEAFVPRILSLCLSLLAGLSGLAAAAEPGGKAANDREAGETLILRTDWKGERIALPPAFAPAMKLKGIEEIRFAPGMFQAQSDSFFSYAFVFSVAKEQSLTQEVIQREILVYYQGLAESVSKGRGRTVDTGKFAFKLERAKQVTGKPEQLPAATPVTQYAGELDWVEPFATGKPQVLHFEIHSWSDPGTGRNYLFVCTSPKSPGETEGVWKELRALRRSFEVKGQPKNSSKPQ